MGLPATASSLLSTGAEVLAPEIRPWLCISGINRGPNLSVDVLHSGTVSAAREASLYGLPSLSVSLATYSHQDYSQSIEATLALVERLSRPGHSRTEQHPEARGFEDEAD